MSGSIGTNSARRSGTIGAVAGGPTVSASDPTITTNSTLGTQWANSTSGEFYICTDATADANVWTNVGSGSGDIHPYTFQGTVSGYTCGGYTGSSTDVDVIDKFSFSSDANATDVGDLTVINWGPSGQTSFTHGYTAGGGRYTGSVSNVIDKFSFSSDGNASDVGDLTAARKRLGGQSSSTYGYASGGNTGSNSDIID